MHFNYSFSSCGKHENAAGVRRIFITGLLITVCILFLHNSNSVCENGAMHINTYIGCNDDYTHYFIATKTTDGQKQKYIISYSKYLERRDVKIPEFEIHSFCAYTDMILLIDMKGNMYRYKYGALTLEKPILNSCISIDVRSGSKVCYLRPDGLFTRTGASDPQKIGEYALPNRTRVFILNDERIAIFTPGEVLTLVSASGNIEYAYYGIEDMVRLTPDIYCITVKDNEEGKNVIKELNGKTENGVSYNGYICFPVAVSNNILSVLQWNGIDVSSGAPCIKSGTIFRYFSHRIIDRNPTASVSRYNYEQTREVDIQPEAFIDISLDADAGIFTERLYWRGKDNLLRPYAFPICVNRSDDSTYCVLFADGTWQKRDDGNQIMLSHYIDAAYRNINMVFPLDKYIYWQSKNRLYRVDDLGNVDLSSAIIEIDSCDNPEIYYMHCTDIVAVNMFSLSQNAQVYNLDSLFVKVIDIDREELRIPVDTKHPFTEMTYLTRAGIVGFNSLSRVVLLIDKDGISHVTNISRESNAIDCFNVAGLCNIIILCGNKRLLVYDSLVQSIVYEAEIFDNVPSKIEYICNGVLISNKTSIIYLYESQGEIRLKHLEIAGDSFCCGYFDAKHGRPIILDWRCEAIKTIGDEDKYEVIIKGGMYAAK